MFELGALLHRAFERVKGKQISRNHSLGQDADRTQRDGNMGWIEGSNLLNGSMPPSDQLGADHSTPDDPAGFLFEGHPHHHHTSHQPIRGRKVATTAALKNSLSDGAMFLAACGIGCGDASTTTTGLIDARK